MSFFSLFFSACGYAQSSLPCHSRLTPQLNSTNKQAPSYPPNRNPTAIATLHLMLLFLTRCTSILTLCRLSCSSFSILSLQIPPCTLTFADAEKFYYTGVCEIYDAILQVMSRGTATHLKCADGKNEATVESSSARRPRPPAKNYTYACNWDY